MTDTALPFDANRLDKLADVIVGTGLNLAHGQDLVITASAEALPLVRRVTVAAYKAGAGLVTPILSDEAIGRARFLHGHDGTFDRAPGWLYSGMAEAYDANAARLHIAADNPMALAQETPAPFSSKTVGSNATPVTDLEPIASAKSSRLPFLMARS